MPIDFAAYRGTRLCVTGGAGFIGSHLCDALVEHGADVCAIDDLSSGRESNLTFVRDRVRFINASILDRVAMRKACDGAAIIFHQAAIASVPRSVREPALYFEVNAIGTEEVLLAARDARARRVVFAASSSAYGDQPGQPRVETMPPDARSPYAAAKCAAEYFVRAFSRCFDLSAISLRYFNIFGPRQRADSPYAAVLPRFIDAYRRGEKPVIYGDGAQTRDFTYVANAVHANLLAGVSERALQGDVVNIACGAPISVLEMLREVAHALNVKPEYETAPPRIGEVRHSVASIDVARELIGYEPIVDVREGLRRTIAANLSS